MCVIPPEIPGMWICENYRCLNQYPSGLKYPWIWINREIGKDEDNKKICSHLFKVCSFTCAVQASADFIKDDYARRTKN